MAINIRCKCGGESKLTAKRCHRCGGPFPKQGKKYKIVLRVGGQKVSKTVSNLDLARDIEASLRLEISRGELKIKKNIAPTVQDVWEKFLSWAKANKKTWRSDECNYRKHIGPSFGSKRLDLVSPFDVEALIIRMKKGRSKTGKVYSPATIRHQLILLSHLYSKADQWGLYSGPNPCKKVKKPKLDNQITEFLSDEELARLLTVLSAWHNKMSACFVRFAMFSGIRRGEMFKLTWDDVDLGQKTITLRDPKGAVTQTLPISEEALQVLKEVPREFDTPYVFYGKEGKQRTDFKGPWLRIRQAAGLPPGFRFHGLRHNFASTLVSNGVPLYTVQKLLCHKDATTTQRYAHLADSTLRDAVNVSGRLLAPKDNVVKLEVKNG